MKNLPKEKIIFGVIILALLVLVGYQGYKTFTEKEIVLIPKGERKLVEFCVSEFTKPICEDRLQTFEDNRTNSVLELLTKESK